MKGGLSAHEPVLEHLESRVLLSAQSQVDSALAAGWQDKPDEPGGGAGDFLPAAYQGILPNGTAALHGATWYDADQDGIRDAGEPGLPDWTIYLDLNDNGVLDGSGTVNVPSTDVPKGIVDNTTTTSIAVVSGLVGQVRDVNVTLNITHTYCGDLDVFLIGPTGVNVELFTDVGGSGNNFTNTTLDDEAADAITAGTAPFTGSFRPEGLLSGFDGLVANGTWTLSVTDDAGADQGTLNSWSLTIETGEPTVVTAGDGSYGFAGLDAGTYAIREVSQPGWTQTFPADAHRVPLADGQVAAGLDFGNHAAPGRIEGGKWYDGDRDGVWDANEPPLAGWKIYLDVNEDGQWNDGEPFDITGADGRYALENVPPTRQLVREVLQDGWTQSFPRAGGGAGGSAFYAWNWETDGLFAIDADGGITDLPPAGAGADSIGGLAFDSLDGILYGLEDGGDLFRFDLPTGAATALGNVGMAVSFALAYNPLDDLLYSATDSGQLVQIDPDALTSVIVSGPGPQTGSGGMEFFPDDGRIYCHSNGSPRMYSYDAVTFAGPTTHADPTQMSNFGMAYDGTSLILGPGGGDTLYSYDPVTGVTAEVFPAGTLGGRGLDGLTGMGGGGGGHAVVVSPGQTAAGVDFGNHADTQIDGTKWFDADSDGVRDPEEPGLGGWRIYVDANGDGEWTDDEPFDVTDANGSYSLYVLPGTLTVREEARAGWTQTYPADAHVVTVDLGQQVAGVDFGNHAPTRIRGSKWQDLDLDGLWDVGEPGLAGWKIYVDANRDGEWTDGEPFDITDQDGHYEIDGLLPGEHIVAEVPQAGWTQSFPGGTPAAASTTQAARDLLLAALTTTGSKAPMYAATVGLGARPDGEAPQGELTPYTNVSGPLIGMDQFRSDPRFAGIDGSGFSVVILDTGIDLNHPFFGPDANADGIADRIVYQWDFAYGDPDASDVNGHGSNVSSIAAGQDATYTGMAPGANIIALKVLDDSGGGDFSMLEQALQWVVANAAAYNIASLNLSLGDGGNYTSPVGLYGIDDEMAALAALDVIVASASGNSFYGHGSAQGVGYPSADANSLSIGAVWDSNNGGPFNWSSGAIDYTTGADRITSFSQRHETMTDVFAPGAQILGAGATGGTTNYSGTSQATPHITGIAALCQQLATQFWGRRMTLQEMRDLFRQTGVTIHDGDDEDDNVTNTGLDFPRVDMVALANAIVGGSPSWHVVTIGPGETVEDVDFGNYQSAAVEGGKWYDADRDGVWDAEEPGLEGWRIYADANANGQWDDGEVSAMTAADGRYTLTVSAPGTHTIREDPQAGWTQTHPADAYVLTVAPGDVVPGTSFGNYAETAIRGHKWYDADGDGAWDAGEQPLAGWKIYVDLDESGQWEDGEPFDITAADGSYALLDLAPGTLAVGEVPQDGWEQTYPVGAAASGGSWQSSGRAVVEGVYVDGPAPAGVDVAPGGSTRVSRLTATGLIDFDDLAAPSGFSDTVAARDEYAALGVHFDGPAVLDGGGILNEGGNFGVSGHSSPNFLAFNAGASFSNGGVPRAPETIYFDVPTDSVQASVGSDSGTGATLTLKAYSATGSLLASGAVTLGSTLQPVSVTAANIDHVVVETSAAVFVLDDLQWSGGGGGGAPGFHIVELAPGQTVDGVDFGNCAHTEIRGTKWYDADLSGVREPDEPGLAGWKIYADLDDSGQWADGEPFALTGGDGSYVLADLPPGTYRIREGAQPGWVQLLPADAHIVALAPGDVIDGVDFVNWAEPGRIEGAKWFDANQNGQRDVGEPGLEGWEIYVDLDGDGQRDDGEPFDVTGPDGTYAIENVPPGRHVVDEVLRAGWLKTWPSGGTFYASDFEANDGGWVPTATWDPVGDWEWGVPTTGPGAAFSGQNVWATKLGDGYTNAGGTSYLSRTFDFTGQTDLQMSWQQWVEIYYSWDTARLRVNGDVLYERTTDSPTPGYEQQAVNLSPYAGLSSVEVVFELYATDVVNRPGWYVDDVRIEGTGTGAHVIDVAPGETIADVDFGNYANVGVYGGKWYDADRNGQWDADEPGLAGWKIYADLNADGQWTDGEPFGTTDEQGGYAVPLGPGTYTIREELRPGWTQMFPAGGHTVTVGLEPVDGVNFGNWAPAGSVLGVKWYDADRDGQQDPGEPGLGGWKIFVDLNGDGEWTDGEPFDISGADGSYGILDVPLGTYDVLEELQDGWTQSFPGGGGGLFYGWDNDAKVLFTVDDAGTMTDLTPALNVGWLNGLAFDTTRGQLYGEGSETFYRFDLGTGAATLLGSVSTEMSGALAYNPLDGCLYNVTPAGQLVRIDVDALAAAPVGGPGPGTGASGMEYYPLDGRLYCHSNGSPRMYSYDAATFAGPVTGPTPTVANHFGMAFDGANLVIGPGSDSTLYTYNPASGATTPRFPAGTLGGRNLNGLAYLGGGSGGHTVTIMPGEVVDGIDFGNHANSEIGGTKWFDADADGVRDAEEPGLEGWKIYVDVNGDGEWANGEPFDLTDADGSYAIGIWPGTHVVREEPQAGWTQTAPVGGHTIVVDPGQTVGGVDFGNHAPTRIRGGKWHDLDKDSVWDPGEPGLEGWRIYLDLDADGQWGADEPFDVTGADGLYEIGNVLPGSYLVAEELQPGWAQSFPLVRPAPTGMAAAQADLLAGLTTTGSDRAMYLGAVDLIAADSGEVADGRIAPATDVSGPLIGMDQFRSDPRFAGIDGSGFSVVILDTGIDLNHPFFGPDANADGIADRIVYSWDFADGDPDASDVHGHGSNVSSIAAGQDPTYTGMAPGADLIHLKVFTDGGSGNFAYLEQALQWVVANAAAYNVASLNMSLGDSGNYGSPMALYGIDDEMAALAALDVIVVSSAGNSFYESAGVQGVGYPAADPSSMAIGAVWDSNNGGPFNWSSGAIDYTTGADRIVSFSQRHETMTEVFAPGARITGAGPTGGTITFSGTSQAAPHITGIAALCQQMAWQWLGRRLSLQEVSDLLRKTGTVVHDGDDEDDNVINTNLDYSRVDMMALGEEILAMARSDVHRVQIAPGQTIDDVDFGNYQAASLQGGKWYDADRDGVRDAEEPGLEGWRIYADANGNGQWDAGEPSAMTAADGRYTLTVSAPGTYTVREDPQAGWTQTHPADAYVVTVAPGDVLSGLDFGNFGVGEVHGGKWHDADQDGEWDAGEVGLAGWMIYADLDGSGQWDAGEPFDLTGADGSYALTDLMPGLYEIREVLQAGWTQTFPADAHVVTVAAGEVVEDVNFGNWASTGIRGTKWYDADQDGERDAGEPGLPDWTIYLDLNRNGVLDGSGAVTIPSTDVPQPITDNTTTWSDLTVTGIAGEIRDLNVTLDITHTFDGDLEVWLIGPTGVEVELFSFVGGGGENFANTTLDDEAAAGIASGSPPFTGSFRPMGLLSDFDGLGANGTWTLSVHDAAGADQGTLNSWSITLEAGEPTARTDRDGDYEFADLAPGTYTVREVLQPGWTATFPPDGHTVTVGAAETVVADFGNWAPPGAVEGGKWFDTDRDGQWDPEEPGLAGWTIYVDSNANGQRDDGEPFAVTGADGRYRIEGLIPGEHVVAEVLQDGWIQTFPGGGGGGADRLFAVDASTSEFVEIDPITGAELNRLPMPEPASAGPDGLAFDGTSLFYASGGAYGGGDTLYEIDPDTGDVVDVDPFLALGLTSGIDGLGAYGGRVIAFDTDLGMVYFIDTALDRVVGSWLSPVPGRGGLAGAGSRGTIFLTDFFSGSIYELSAETGDVVNVLFDPLMGTPLGLAYGNGSLFLGDSGSGSIAELDPDTGLMLNLFLTLLDITALGGDDASGVSPFEALPNGTHRVEVRSGQTVTDVDFGNWMIVPLPPPVLLADFDTGLRNDDHITRYDNSDPGKVLGFRVSDTTPGAILRLYAGDLLIGQGLAGDTWMDVYTDGSTDLADGAHLITATQQLPGQPESQHSPATQITVDTAGPRITAFGISCTSGRWLVGVIDSSVWTTDRNMRTAPWSVINELVVDFDEPVVGALNDMTLEGLLAGPRTMVALSGSETARLNWTTAVYLNTDRYVVSVLSGDAGVQDIAGNPLDGESHGDVFPTGDTVPGGDWQWALNVLVGDNDGSGRVDLRDRRDLRDHYGARVGDDDYSILADYNGDGRIDLRDRRLQRDAYGDRLPTPLALSAALAGRPIRPAAISRLRARYNPLIDVLALIDARAVSPAPAAQ